MLFKVAICDDDKQDIAVIKKHLNDYSFQLDIDFEIYIFSNSELFLSQYTEPGTFHILFLDVEMPGMSGLEVATKIRQLPDKNAKIIFVSNYPEYMQDSFNVQAYHYLIKPLKYSAFMDVMNKILDDYQTSHITKMLVKQDGQESLILLNDIISIESLDSKKKLLKINLLHEEVVTNGLINDWEKELKSQNFVSPARGFLVNILHIHYINDTSLIMSNNIYIPLSRRKEKELRSLFTKRLLTITNIH